MKSFRIGAVRLALSVVGIVAASGVGAVDNSSLGSPDFREHKATYGLVYRLPKDVTDVLDNKIYPPLRERLIKLGLVDEARTFNLQHVTVVHLHNADPTTPAKMLKALPKVPPVLKLTLKDFYNTEASKGAGAPWWFDLGVVKSGQGLYGDDVLQHRGNGRADAAAGWAVASCHRPGIRKHERGCT